MTAGTIKHVAVHDLLAQQIERMSPGDRLPTEAQLCKQLNVSRITVRRAMADLEQEGLIVREQGRGTFASRPALPQVFRETLSEHVTGFHRQQTELGHSVTSTVVSNEVVFDIRKAELLRLAPSQPLVRLERLRYVNQQLHQHVVTWLDAVTFGDVAQHDFTDASLFDYLRSAHSILLTRNDLTIRILQASDETANFLNVPRGTCLLGMDSTVFAGDRLIAFGTTTHAPGFGEIEISLQANPSISERD